jgi:hypothetical protein
MSTTITDLTSRLVASDAALRAYRDARRTNNRDLDPDQGHREHSQSPTCAGHQGNDLYCYMHG